VPSKRGGLLGDTNSDELLQVLLGDGDVDTATAAGATSGHREADPTAEYDDAGTPVNKAAKREIAREWATGVAAGGGKPRVVQLQFAVLEVATGGFDEFNEIGEGGSCSVFTNRVFGVVVAIKRLNESAGESGAEQFAAECAILTGVLHPNICRLLAFSNDGPQHCLVLELCSGGSLESRLACEASGAGLPPPPLGWGRRIHIAKQIARALAFLHTRDPPILHRDVKTANVLLDAAGNAKVADFGISLSNVLADAGAGTHRTTKTIAGTKVYMPIEYIQSGHMSDRTDAYAFGVVLMELLTGRPPERAAETFAFEGPGVFARVGEIADRKAGKWPPAVLRVIGAGVAAKCLDHAPRHRATVKSVLPALEALPCA
jgi:serine/threonine protein kinase